MNKMTSQRAEMSQAAVEVARFAKAEASGTATQEELDAMRPRGQELFDRVEKNMEKLWQDLADMQSQDGGPKMGEFLKDKQFVKDVLRKLEDVGSMLGEAATSVWKAEQSLDEKLDVTKAMIASKTRSFVELRSAAADLKHLTARARFLDDRVHAGLERAQATDADDARALRALLDKASTWRPADPEAAVAALERRLSQDEAA